MSSGTNCPYCLWTFMTEEWEPNPKGNWRKNKREMGGARINLQFTANWLWRGDLKKNRCGPQCTLQFVFQFRPEAGSKKLGKMIPAWIPCVSIWVNTALAVRYGQTLLSQAEPLWPHKLNAASAQRPPLTSEAQDGTPPHPHPRQEPRPGRTGTGLGVTQFSLLTSQKPHQ